MCFLNALSVIGGNIISDSAANSIYEKICMELPQEGLNEDNIPLLNTRKTCRCDIHWDDEHRVFIKKNAKHSNLKNKHSYVSDIDDCDPNPCFNGGSCTDDVDSFNCDCAGTGFTGVQCQIGTVPATQLTSQIPRFRDSRTSDVSDSHTSHWTEASFHQK